MTKEQTQLMEMLEKLKLTPELMNEAVDSVRDENHDASDTALAEAIAEVINTRKHVGPEGKVAFAYAITCLSAAAANAVRMAAQVTAMLDAGIEAGAEGAEEAKEKLLGALQEAIFSHAPKELKAHIAKMQQSIPQAESLLFIWGLMLEGMKSGMFMGWRMHEIALLQHSTEGEAKE